MRRVQPPAPEQHTRRVLMTADTIGGVFNYAVELGRQLARHRVELVLATMGRPLSRDQRQQLARLPSVDVRESHYSLEWMDDAYGEVDRAGQWLLELERETRPEVVHVNGYAHGVLPFAAPLVIVAHSCVLSWWRAVRGEAAPARYDEYRRRVTRALRRAALVVAPTRSMLRALLRCYGLVPHGRVISNGVEMADFAGRPKEPFFLAAGRLWDGAKNLESLCAAAAASEQSWPLYVAGDASPARPPGVTYLGRLPQPELWAHMARARVFVHPARYEPFGLAPLEAAASGCALLLGDIDSLHEVWGDAALYAEPGDVAALAAAMRRLQRDPALCERLSVLARRRAADYSSERMVLSYLGVYGELQRRRSGTHAAVDATALCPRAGVGR